MALSTDPKLQCPVCGAGPDTILGHANADKPYAECRCSVCHLSYRVGRDPAPDMVNHPPHYNQHPSGIECIEVTRHFNFNLGNVIKYIWRAAHKGVTLEDLKKARWYLDDEIKLMEQQQNGTKAD